MLRILRRGEHGFHAEAIGPGWRPDADVVWLDLASPSRDEELAVEALLRVGPDVEIETRVIRTEGDRRRDVPLEEIGGEGVFVKDIERRLAKGEIDLAVHSLKDMPAQTPEGLEIGAVLARGDPRDALVSRDGARLQSLPAGARIGTDSRRRAVQLLALRPDVRPASIRGNVDTRLRKVAACKAVDPIAKLRELRRVP